jgi:hypothetical protein
MSEPPALQADVFVSDTQLPMDQEKLLVDGLALVGVTSRVRVVPVRRGLDQLNWLLLVALPLQGFLTAVGGQLAQDAYREFTKRVRRLLGRGEQKAGKSRPVVFQDTATGVQVVLEPGIPEEGYQQLLSLDLSQFRLGPVHYDVGQRRWRSELDEARS